MTLIIFWCTFFFWATSFNFFPVHADPTRNSAILIDNILISRSPSLKFTSDLVFTNLTTSLFIYYFLCLKQRLLWMRKASFLLEPKEYSNLINGLQSNDCSSVIEANDVECATRLFLCRKGTLLDKHLSLRKRPRNSSLISPWMSRGLTDATNMKASLFKSACKSKTQEDLTKYKHYKNVLTSSIRTSKKLYFSRRVIECKGNFRKIWTVVNGALSRRKSKQSSPCLYRWADGSILGKKTLESALNSYYTTIRSVVIPPQSRVSCFTLAEKSFSFPMQCYWIYSGISQLPISRSVDSFGLSNNVLKKKPVCFWPQLTYN